MKRIITSIIIGSIGVSIFLFAVKDAPIPISRKSLMLLFFGITIGSLLLLSMLHFFKKKGLSENEL
jgi:hypothetical protein